MLWTIFVILLVLWLLGLVSSYTLGGFIHILLVVAVVVLLIQLLSGSPTSALRESCADSSLGNICESISKEEHLKRSLIAADCSVWSRCWAAWLWPPPKRILSSGCRMPADVLKEIMDAPDKGIPEEVLDDAKCIVVVPHLIKAGFIVGGKHGRGVASCRTATGWSAPAFISVGGGSWGLQIGAEGVDLVMLVMNDKGLQHLLSSKFQLSGEGSAAAGPVGRHASAGTDWKMNAELLTYSRSKGAFAGLTLEGAVIEQDADSTTAIYGRDVGFPQSPHRRRETARCGCALHVRTLDGRPSGCRPRSQGRHAGQETKLMRNRRFVHQPRPPAGLFCACARADARRPVAVFE